MVTITPTTAAVAAWRTARIPERFQSAMANDDIIADCLHAAEPADYFKKWMASFRDGEVLVSDNPRLCGRGLYLVGGFEADFMGAVVLQVLLLEGQVSSGLYLNVEDFLESEAPDGERLGERRWVDLLVLRGLGEHYSTATNWANSTLAGLVRRRLDKGLPTVVSTGKPPQESGLPPGLLDQAFVKILFGKRGRDG